MNMKGLLVGAVSGGVVMFVLGYLIWEVAFVDFFAAHSGSATGVGREIVLEWAVALGTLSLAILVTLCLGWSGATTIGAGFKVGAIVGLLAWLGVDLILYGATNLQDLTAVCADALLELVRTGIGGATIAAVVSKLSPAAADV